MIFDTEQMNTVTVRTGSFHLLLRRVRIVVGDGLLT